MPNPRQTRARGASNRAQHDFSRVPSVSRERSSFDRSHQYKTTLNAGLLIPYFIDEVSPGDTFSLNSTLFARLATPIVPIMDNAYVETHFFFVPNRLVWDNWERFMGQQDDPESSTDYLIPSLAAVAPGSAYTLQKSSVADYFGLPVGVSIPNSEQGGGR